MRSLKCAPALLVLLMPAFAVENVDVQAIVQRSVEAENADWQAQPNYSFVQTEHEDDTPAKTYQVVMILGSRYRRLIAVNGRPLSPGEQATETSKMQKEIEKRDHESPEDRAKRIADYRKTRDQEHVMLAQMAKAFKFRLIGEPEVDGHPTWELEATPLPGYEPPNQRAKVLTGMQGKLWVAKDGFHWVKVEAEVVQPVYFEGFLARVGPGTRFELTKAPVGNGVWEPTRFDMNVSARILGVIPHNSQETDIFGDYKLQLAPTLAAR